MIMDDAMKNALAEGLSRDPGGHGAADVAGFLAGLPTGLGVDDPFHWSGALVVIRHLCFSSEHSAAAMRVLDVVRASAFGAAVEAAGGPAASGWASVPGRVRGTRLDREDLVIAHVAFIVSAPGYGEQAIAAADLDAITDALLIGEEDRRALISHGDEAVEPGRPLRVDRTPGAGDVEPGRREAGVWRAFDALVAADPDIACLADLLVPGYPEQRPGRIGAVPVTAAMLEEATASLGARYRSASPQSDAAHAVLAKLHGACRERPVEELVTRHTRHLITADGDPAAARARFRATGGEYDDAVAAAAPARGPLVLPEHLGHAGELDVAAVVVSGDRDAVEKAAVRTLGAACGLVSLLLLFSGIATVAGGLAATACAVVVFRWADRTRHYAGAMLAVLVATVFWPTQGGFFGGFELVAFVAIILGSPARYFVGARRTADAPRAPEEATA